MTSQPPRVPYHPRAYELEVIEKIDIECVTISGDA